MTLPRRHQEWQVHQWRLRAPEQKGGKKGRSGGPPPAKNRKERTLEGLTLDMIREAMRAELGKSRDELGASIASVREEVAFFSKRVDSTWRVSGRRRTPKQQASRPSREVKRTWRAGSHCSKASSKAYR